MRSSQASAIIDMRSDTVTQPTDQMRKAMAESVVGDDVYDEDPTVNDLQTRIALMLGKEAALFVPSGTMGNLIALMSHGGPGDEVILGDQSHIYFYEQGGASSIAHLHPRPLINQKDGTIKIDDIVGAIRPTDLHMPTTRLIVLENTHNRCGGRVLKLDYLENIAKLKAKYQIHTHMDGARLWNAACALDTNIKNLCTMFDTVNVCFSKGLGAPVGSALCGTAEIIAKAKRWRKALGGGMRQVGVLASAAMVALDDNLSRIDQDHKNAKIFAQVLAKSNGTVVNIEDVETNIVIFRLISQKISPKDLLMALKSQGILLSSMGGAYLRAVTHLQITENQVLKAAEAISDLLR